MSPPWECVIPPPVVDGNGGSEVYTLANLGQIYSLRFWHTPLCVSGQIVNCDLKSFVSLPLVFLVAYRSTKAKSFGPFSSETTWRDSLCRRVWIMPGGTKDHGWLPLGFGFAVSIWWISLLRIPKLLQNSRMCRSRFREFQKHVFLVLCCGIISSTCSGLKKTFLCTELVRLTDGDPRWGDECSKLQLIWVYYNPLMQSINYCFSYKCHFCQLYTHSRKRKWSLCQHFMCHFSISFAPCMKPLLEVFWASLGSLLAFTILKLCTFHF